MAKNKQFLFLNHLWDKESGLSGMFVLLFIMHFVLIPVFGSFSSFMVIINIFWMLFLIAGIISLSKSRKHTLMFIIILAAFILFRWLSVFVQSPFVHLGDIVFTILTFGLLIYLVLVKVFEP